MLLESFKRRLKPELSRVDSTQLVGGEFMNSFKNRLGINIDCPISPQHRMWLSDGFPHSRSELHFSLAHRDGQTNSGVETDVFYVQSAEMERRRVAYLLISKMDEKNRPIVKYIQIVKRDGNQSLVPLKEEITELRNGAQKDVIAMLKKIMSDKGLILDKPIENELHNTPKNIFAYADSVESFLG